MYCKVTKISVLENISKISTNEDDRDRLAYEIVKGLDR